MQGNEGTKGLIKKLDLSLVVLPLLVVTILCIVFIVFPDRSTEITDNIRAFIGSQFGWFYILLGLFVFATTMYIAFSRYGKIRLGNLEKPEYSSYKWGTMVFTSVMAADLIFFSFIEWALYAEEIRIEQLGTVQDWAPTLPLFHWGPIPWSFYIVLAVAFGFMLHVRKTTKQKFSEACRPLFGNRIDGFAGKLIDFIAICALLAGTATTFSLATPLVAAALSQITGLPLTAGLTAGLLITIALIYTITVLAGMKGIIFAATVSFSLLGFLLVTFLFVGGETQYIIETGITSIGLLTQNFIGLATWMDPLRTSGHYYGSFVQDWTIFFWAYWMAWCAATPFFLAMISRGRTIRNVIIGGYGYGLAGTFLSFIVFGNYGLSQQLAGTVDAVGTVSAGYDMSIAIIQIFETMPFTELLLVVLIVMMVLFYSTTFDSKTMVVAKYSYKNLEHSAETSRPLKLFWAGVFIVFPIGLIFAENAINSLLSVAIIAAFPIGFIFCIIIFSFFKDARLYLEGK